jgi:Putative metallopeptidase domain
MTILLATRGRTGENVARLAGKLPGSITRGREAAEAARIDWRERLRRAWSETAPTDYSWVRPNRRYVWSGLYFTGVRARLNTLALLSLQLFTPVVSSSRCSTAWPDCYALLIPVLASLRWE